MVAGDRQWDHSPARSIDFHVMVAVLEREVQQRVLVERPPLVHRVATHLSDNVPERDDGHRGQRGIACIGCNVLELTLACEKLIDRLAARAHRLERDKRIRSTFDRGLDLIELLEAAINERVA